MCSRPGVLFFCFLYVAAFLAPVAHGLLLEGGTCSECEARGAAGPTVSAAGDVPLGDPHRHYHGVHDHANCPVCAHGQIASLPPLSFEFIVLPQVPNAWGRGSELSLPHSSPFGLPEARAPPRLS